MCLCQGGMRVFVDSTDACIRGRRMHVFMDAITNDAFVCSKEGCLVLTRDAFFRKTEVCI